MFKSLIVIASLTAAMSTAAGASTTRLNDAQYVAAARCEALIAAPALGGGDTSAINSMLKAEGRGREQQVFDRADEARSDAAREARHAGPAARAGLSAERNGVCQAWNNGPAPGMSAAASSQPTGAN